MTFAVPPQFTGESPVRSKPRRVNQADTDRVRL
jgi:hypothetical protein